MADEEIDEQFVPTASLSHIKFDLLTSVDMEKLSVVNVVDTNYLTDSKMGLPNETSQCATCGSKNVKECDGHSGVIKLPATIFHPYFLSEVVQLLNSICPGCLSLKQEVDLGSLTLDGDENLMQHGMYGLKVQKSLNGLQTKLMDTCNSQSSILEGNYSKEEHEARLLYLSKCLKIGKTFGRTADQASCKYCARSGSKLYPAMRFKYQSSKDMLGGKFSSISVEVEEKKLKKLQGLPDDYWNFIPYVGRINKGRFELSPYQVFHLLNRLNPVVMEQFLSRRELLFLSCLPVSANCHRISEILRGDGPRLSFDERTKAYKRLIDASKKIDDLRQQPDFSLRASTITENRVVECLRASKLHTSALVEESSKGLFGIKWLKDAVLSKRSDNAFRMIMIGDPKINLWEIGLPLKIAECLVIGEHVNDHNVRSLNMRCNLHLLSKEELQIRRLGQLRRVRKPNQLKVGDLVYRPLQNGDPILVNRPPSVHQHSLIALYVKILPGNSVASINPLVCMPLLGDFDGDCLHGYIPQSFHAQVELRELVSLDQQLFNSQDGRSLVSLTQDSLVSAYLLTGSDVFLTNHEMQQLSMMLLRELPPASIIKAVELCRSLWTGKQLFGMFFPPGLNFTMESKMVRVSDGEVLNCSTSSSWLQNSAESMFSVMFQLYGSKALDLLSYSQEALCEYLSLRGLSVSLSDLFLSLDYANRQKLIEEVNVALEEAIYSIQTKRLILDPQFVTCLMKYDESEDQYFDTSFVAKDSLRLTRLAVGAFKDVFSDIIKLVHLHVNKENSVMSMINAGSKGSVLKLVQQSVCVGLQLARRKYPFKVPSQLSCVSWNNQKETECQLRPNTWDSSEAQSSYTVIRSSFLDGLNPLECLVHAISGRANFFGENAEVPGTLNRKLMFFLRDLYVAYDGTVRNAYGQNIIQFSYNATDDSVQSFDTNSVQAGSSVGSLAASAISEAAYGALDNPVNGLEDCPLMNLQELLKSGKSKCSNETAGFLFISKHLQKYRYGLEYGSLEVKNHLEAVYLSDLVYTVMILYDGRSIENPKRSPWTVHFHLAENQMKKKGLEMLSMVIEIDDFYITTRKVRSDLPRLFFTENKCTCGDEYNKSDQRCCITVTAEKSDRGSMSVLNILKESVIPLLLKIPLKGFMEFRHVEIQCNVENQLLVKVMMSEHCSREKFWSVILNACLPIMDLIDWEASYPNSVHDVSKLYGIDAGWTLFYESLKATISDIGRVVKREHLAILADSLSVGGEFHSLSSHGLKLQRKRLSISSPFSQACFSGPANSFVDAAKQGSVDNLSGTLDAIAWGKEAKIGSSGPFALLYSGKEYLPDKKQSIYKELCDHQAADSSYKWCSDNGRQSDDRPIEIKDYRRDRSSITLNAQEMLLDSCIGSWTSVVEMCTYLQEVLRKYPFEACISEEDSLRIKDALGYHPRMVEKIGPGIEYIKIGRSPSHMSSRCFVLVRTDGSTEDFSYRKCVIGAATQVSSELGRLVERKLYHGL